MEEMMVEKSKYFERSRESEKVAKRKERVRELEKLREEVEDREGKAKITMMMADVEGLKREVKGVVDKEDLVLRMYPNVCQRCRKELGLMEVEERKGEV